MKNVKVIVPTLGLILIVGWIYYSVDIRNVIIKIKSVDNTFFVPALGLSIIQIFMSSKRYFFFVCASDFKVTYDKCFHAVLSAFALNSIIPGKGGDLVKAVTISENKKQLTHLTVVTFIERGCDLSVLVLLSICGSLVLGSNHWKLTSTIFISIFLCVILLVYFFHNNPSIRKKVGDISEIFLSFKKNIRYFLVALSFSFFFWQINLVIIWLLLHSIGLSISILKVVALWPIAIFAGILPISVSGFGTRDLTFALSIGDDFKKESIYAATFLYTFLVYWFLSIISAVWLFIKNTMKPKSLEIV